MTIYLKKKGPDITKPWQNTKDLTRFTAPKVFPTCKAEATTGITVTGANAMLFLTLWHLNMEILLMTSPCCHLSLKVTMK